MEVPRGKGARRRKSQRVSIFDPKSKSDDDYSEADLPKQPDQDSTKKQRASSKVSAGKGLSKPVPSIEFVHRKSDPLESRIYEPSWLSKTWKGIMEGIIEPQGLSPEESYIYQCQSFGMHILHVILVFWVFYGTFDLEHNYHSITVSDVIRKSHFDSRFVMKSIRFNEIYAPIHIWDFIRGVLLKFIYPVDTYNNTHSILQDNVMVGVVQMRQVRVKNDTCETVPLFRDLYKSCYGSLSDDDAEDKEPFGLKSSPAWRYSINLDKDVRGKFADYTGSGYAMNFSQDYNWTLDQLDELENNQWIRLGTRAVFLDFAMYCPNTNTFLVTKLSFEIMPWGRVYPSLYIYSIKVLSSFNDSRAFLLLGLGIALLGFAIGLNYALFLRLKRNGMKTLLAYKNLIDVAIISSTYAILGVHIAIVYHTIQKLESIASMINKSENPTFGILVRLNDMYLNVAAVLLLCIMLKFFRYALYLNETAKIMVCAIRKVKGELICFTIMNLCVLFGWGFIFCIIYGLRYTYFKSPIRCLETLIHSHVRDYTLYEDDTDVRVLSVDFDDLFILLTVPVAVLYVNCISQQTYVALMVHGWELAVRDCSKEAGRIKASEMVLTRIVQILENMKLHKWSNKLQEHYIIQMNEDDYYPLTEILRRYGWTHLEIRLLLKKHGIRKGDDLKIDELFEVYQDFWMRNTLFFEVAGHEGLLQDLKYAQRLIKYCESTIADLKLSMEQLADGFLEKQVKKPIKKELSSASENTTSTPRRRSLLGRGLRSRK